MSYFNVHRRVINNYFNTFFSNGPKFISRAVFVHTQPTMPDTEADLWNKSTIIADTLHTQWPWCSRQYIVCLPTQAVFLCARCAALWLCVVSTPITLTHWSRDKMAAKFLATISNAFSWMKIYKFQLKFHWSLFSSVQLTIFRHWFR